MSNEALWPQLGLDRLVQDSDGSYMITSQQYPQLRKGKGGAPIAAAAQLSLAINVVDGVEWCLVEDDCIRFRLESELKGEQAIQRVRELVNL